MRNFKYLLISAILFGCCTNHTFGAIESISIIDSYFTAEGYISDNSYSVSDPIYASGSTQSQMEYAFSEAGLVGSEKVVASALVQGEYSFARGSGELVFSPLAETLTLTHNSVGSVYFYYDYGLCTLIDQTTGTVLFQSVPNPFSPAQSFTWNPDIAHLYRLTYDVSLPFHDAGTAFLSMEVEIIPEPCTLLLLGIGGLVMRKR